MAHSVLRDENYRLQRLRAFGILDTSAESHFDAITKSAAHILRTPIALLNFIDEAREWCKSAWGMKRRHAKRSESLCAEALAAGDVLVILNAAESVKYRNHPQVTGKRAVVFYAGIVLKTSDGIALGTLCAIDHCARNVTDDELDTLRTLAATVVGYLENRRLTRELVDAKRLLEGAASSRDEFLAMLAHELRAPLAPIHTAVEILQSPDATDAQRTWSKDALRRHTRYLGQIVDDLLSASMVSIGAIDLSLEPVNVSSLIKQSVELCDAYIVKGGHTLTVIGDDALYADADVTQGPLIISNLLRNAATYTPAGGHITVAVDADETEVRIRVRDSGIGISPEDIDDIFLLFRQTGRSLARSAGGMGLGLTLARRLAELHGGSLVARSEGIGHGSEFTLTLRRSLRLITAASQPERQPLLVARPLSVLVVDDNHDTADAMGMYFEVAGHHARVVYDAAGALALVTNWTPDVVLSDIGLPDMDGYALARALRKLSGLTATTFVAVTGYASKKDRDTALEAGFDAHFAKPADAGRLERFVLKLRAKKARAR
jgi:signal transduction histidine kinase/ActR/RegA family two-component response regulator